MTPEQIKLVQESFAKAAPIADQVAAKFYETLFRIDPQLKKLFKGDQVAQGQKLIASLVMVVKGLTKLDTIVEPVRQLGKRHVKYGVKDADYTTVGAALIETLGFFLKDDFTPATKKAWIEAYGLLSSVMIKASHEPA